MGKIINKIVFKSHAEQTIEFLENFDNIDEKDLYVRINREFNIYSLIELVLRLSKNKKLEKYHQIFKEKDFSEVLFNIDGTFTEIKKKTTKTEYIAYFLDLKMKAIHIKNLINVKRLIDRLDVEIIKGIAVLESDLRDEITLNEIYGLFFIYKKEEAINIFENFLIKYINNSGGYQNLVLKINTIFDDLFQRFDLTFIPHIDSSNFKDESIFNYNSVVHISKDEVYELSRLNVYFVKSIPLANFKKEQLFNINTDFKDVVFTKYILKNLIKYFYEGNLSTDIKNNDIFHFEDKNVFDFFWETITTDVSKRSALELNYAHSTLNKVIGKDRKKQLFLILCFKELKDGDSVINVATKASKILSAYFKENIYSESYIYRLIAKEEPVNKNFETLYDEYKKWEFPYLKEFKNM